jgi:hypothetical protein
LSEYVVIYEQAPDGGWGAYLPDLPGVVALGASRARLPSASRRPCRPTPKTCRSVANRYRRHTTRLGQSRAEDPREPARRLPMLDQGNTWLAC